MTALERFTSKFTVSTGCWNWGACILKNGYGQTYWNGKRDYAHRVSYQIYKGEIPDGLVIDHLCRNKACVNPEHLELVSQSENVLRGWRLAHQNGVPVKYNPRPSCTRGHLFVPENIKLKSRNKYLFRMCRICNRAARKRNRIRHRELITLSAKNYETTETHMLALWL